MITQMTIPKMDKAMRLLVLLERQPMSGVQLAKVAGLGRATVVRLVTDLRELGCKVDSERTEGRDFAYTLRDWGVFDSARVKRYVKARL